MKLFLDREQELMIAGTVLRCREDQGRREEGRHIDGLAVGVLGDGRHGRWRYAYRFRMSIATSRTADNHTSVALNRAAPAPGARQQPAGLLTLPAPPWTIWRRSSGWIRWRSSTRTPNYSARRGLQRINSRRPRKLIDWKKHWQPRGAGKGPIKRDSGSRVHMWGGGGHDSQCKAIINPDGR